MDRYFPSFIQMYQNEVSSSVQTGKCNDNLAWLLAHWASEAQASGNCLYRLSKEFCLLGHLRVKLPKNLLALLGCSHQRSIWCQLKGFQLAVSYFLMLSVTWSHVAQIRNTVYSKTGFFRNTVYHLAVRYNRKGKSGKGSALSLWCLSHDSSLNTALW